MLFDERDLRVFDNPDSRQYFEEILQCYYSKNYRATIVLLYSFVIYDLFMKLQTMASEGNNKAEEKLAEINELILKNEKYLEVEKKIIEFFNKNCKLYFNRFTEDVNYLRECRHKCAHLKVNDNTLYVPEDYQARMLICSMYDNILSVKAPFIMDLFSIVEEVVEIYSQRIDDISQNGLDERIKNEITKNYLERMTYDSLKMSYKTFLKLLFITTDKDAERNAYGLFAFVYAMTDHIRKNGFERLFKEEDVRKKLLSISIENLENSSERKQSLIELILNFPILLDIIKEDVSLFEYISNEILLNPNGIKYYRLFYPRSNKTPYEFFKDNSIVQQPLYSMTLYDAVKESVDFDLAEFSKILINKVPPYNGFNDADGFMNFFKKYLQDLAIEDIESVMSIYMSSNQCVYRSRHSEDYQEVSKYLEEHKVHDTSEDKSN